jgi:hypothetical protein
MLRIIFLVATALLAGCDSQMATIPKPNISAEPIRQPQAIGPFGLMRGMSKTQIEKFGTLTPNPKDPNIFIAQSVPTPFHAFSYYRFNIDKEFGLCAVEGLTSEINTSAQGSELQSEYKALKDILIQKYGTPTVVMEELKEGSFYKTPAMWMLALTKNERMHSSMWETSPQHPLPAELEAILIGTEGISLHQGRLVVYYAFNNNGKCKDKQTKEKSGGL